MISVILGLINFNASRFQQILAEVLNHIALGFVTISLFCDVIKMNFGLDPALGVLELRYLNLSTPLTQIPLNNSIPQPPK